MIQGYMIETSYDGAALRVHGTNKAARVALAGSDHDQDVVIPANEIAGVEFKGANMVTNGRVTISTRAGRQYQLHFRRKQAEQFQTLARDLGWKP